MNNVFEPIVIVGAKRTPIGSFLGALSDYTAPELGAHALRAAIAQAGIAASAPDEALMGCCLFAGLKQAPARQAVLGAGLADSVQATTLSKMCGSGMKAAMLGFDMLRSESASIVLCGGMESMSNAPHLIPRARKGYRLSHGKMLDHMLLDGLEDAYEGKLMGHYADVSADVFSLTREQQDEFAQMSVLRAQHAIASGAFREEITPIASRRANAVDSDIADDETPGDCDPTKLPRLKAIFREGGTVTAGNASSISDGAAALVLMHESRARELGLTPLARIHGHATTAGVPGRFPEAPVHAIERLLQKLHWHRDDVDLYEINEAFAVVTLIAMQALALPHDKVNVNGGACALGHPVGATGARILVTLLYALKQRGLRRGIAALCLGGGEATAMALEIL